MAETHRNAFLGDAREKLAKAGSALTEAVEAVEAYAAKVETDLNPVPELAPAVEQTSEPAAETEGLQQDVKEKNDEPKK